MLSINVTTTYEFLLTLIVWSAFSAFSALSLLVGCCKGHLSVEIPLQQSAEVFLWDCLWLSANTGQPGMWPWWCCLRVLCWQFEWALVFIPYALHSCRLQVTACWYERSASLPCEVLLYVWCHGCVILYVVSIFWNIVIVQKCMNALQQVIARHVSCLLHYCNMCMLCRLVIVSV